MDAEVMWIKNLQEKSFMTDKNQLKIEYQQSQLNPRIHADGIIRVHVRMTNANLPERKEKKRKDNAHLTKESLLYDVTDQRYPQAQLPRWSITNSCTDKK